MGAGARIHTTPLVTVPFWLMVFVMTSSIAINHILNDESYIGREGLIANSLAVIWLIGLFQIGRNLTIDKKATTFLALLMTAAYAACALYFSSENAGVMVMPLVDGDTAEAANYQGMARSVMCSALIIFPFIKNRTIKSLLTIITAATLYKIGSRTELILFAATIPLFAIINYKLKISYAIIITALVGSAALLISGYDVIGSIESFTSGDASLAERAILFDVGIAGIIDHPIQGDYLGQVRDFGATGFYIHNFLSAWQQFGLLGFAIYTYLVLVTVKIGYNCLRSRLFDPHSEALIYLSVVSFIGILTTKPIFWPVPALAWGLAARALSAKAAAQKMHLKQRPAT